MNDEIEGLITSTLKAASGQQNIEKHRDAASRTTSYYAHCNRYSYAISITDTCVEDSSVVAIGDRLVNAALAFQKAPNIEFKMLLNEDQIVGINRSKKA